MKFFGKVESGWLVLYHEDLYQKELNKYEGREVQLTLAARSHDRTLPQNSFYWAYLHRIEDETGNLADDLHEYFKRKLLPPVFKRVLDVEFAIPASTTKLSRKEFGEYIDKITALTGVLPPAYDEYGI